MTTLTELLNNPEAYYPGNFDTPQRANALLTGLCQDAATEIERLNKAVADERERLYGKDIDTLLFEEHRLAFEKGRRSEREVCALQVEKAGIDGYGTLAAAALIRKGEHMIDDDDDDTQGYLQPKREWVGLTEEERFLNDFRSSAELEYAKAIEAKLREKNRG